MARLAGVLVVAVLAGHVMLARQAPPRFGGAYASLDTRRQQLVDDWVARFNRVTGQQVAAGPFYDEIVSVSTKTTFEAITNALMQSSLSDASGASAGDALSIVERLDTVAGQVAGARGDTQFRMYVGLSPEAVKILESSNEFKRGPDNSVYHKGYPVNYREQGGAPSIQISIAADGRRADIDVDYRSSGFPQGLFNGHMTSSNSDVRAGNNFDRHADRWAGFQSWWRGFFGVRLNRSPEAQEQRTTIAPSSMPRVGKKNIDVMANDFLTAWLVEGDIVAAMGYVSPRSYACLADGGDPSEVDRGVAPYQLMVNLKKAREAVGTRPSLVGLTIGARIPLDSLKFVEQPHAAQFVVYSVPDDVAAAFDCENRLAGGPAKPASRQYGNYFGSTFAIDIDGHRDNVVAVLWAREDGYWKIVSWRTGIQSRKMPGPDAMPDAAVITVPADRGLVDAAHAFLDNWLVRKDYDAAFKYFSERSYACYDLERGPDDPAAASVADAGRKIHDALARAGRAAGTSGNLDAMLSPVQPVHPAVRLMVQPYSRTFTLTSVPTSIASDVDCATRASGALPTRTTTYAYGTAFGMNFRFQSEQGDAPVLRLLWTKENGAWRIVAYDVEVP